MTLGEVAQKLGLSVETVRTLEARAMMKLARSVLREFADEGGGDRRRRLEGGPRLQGEPDAAEDEAQGEEPGMWSKRAEGPVLGADEGRALQRAWRIYARFDPEAELVSEGADEENR